MSVRGDGSGGRVVRRGRGLEIPAQGVHVVVGEGVEGLAHVQQFLPDGLEAAHHLEGARSGLAVVAQALAGSGDGHAPLLDEVIDKFGLLDVRLGVLADVASGTLGGELGEFLLPEAQGGAVDAQHLRHFAGGVV